MATSLFTTNHLLPPHILGKEPRLGLGLFELAVLAGFGVRLLVDLAARFGGAGRDGEPGKKKGQRENEGFANFHDLVIFQIFSAVRVAK